MGNGGAFSIVAASGCDFQIQLQFAITELP